MANINLYKSRTWEFFANFHRFPSIYIYIYIYDFQKSGDLENIGQGHDVQHSQWRHSMANINLYESCTWAFFASSHCFPNNKYYLISRNLVILKWLVKVMMYSVCNGAIEWLIPDFLSDGNSNVCSTFHLLRDIRKKSQKFWPWKWT